MFSYELKEHHLACIRSEINTMELYPCNTNMLPPGIEHLLRPQYLPMAPLEEIASLQFATTPYQIQSTSSHGPMNNSLLPLVWTILFLRVISF